MDEVLKPCPFCGGEAVSREYDERNPYEPFGLIIAHAEDCFLALHSSYDEYETRWNTRADAAPTPNAEVVEAVARAVAPMMEGGREFDQMPPTRLELRQWSRSGMCSTNDATQDDATELAQAAIAALDAARGDPVARLIAHMKTIEPDEEGEPVAWLYEHPDGYYNTTTRRDDPSLPTYRGWTETPLYAHPPRGDRVARVVDAIREASVSDADSRDAERLRTALAKRGLKLVEVGDAD